MQFPLFYTKHLGNHLFRHSQAKSGVILETKGNKQVMFPFRETAAKFYLSVHEQKRIANSHNIPIKVVNHKPVPVSAVFLPATIFKQVAVMNDTDIVIAPTNNLRTSAKEGKTINFTSLVNIPCTR